MSSDDSFSAALAAIKKALQGLEKSQKIRAQKWVQRLETVGSHVSRISRQKWVEELLLQVTKRSLREPFLLSPPPTGLPAFPSHILRSAPPPPAATTTKSIVAPPSTLMSSGRSTPLATASAVDNINLLRELEVQRRTVTRQAKEIVKLQALAVQLDDLLLEQRQEHEIELQRLRGGVHDGATSLASSLASSRVEHSVSTAEDALRARMSWTQEHVSKSMPDLGACLGAMLHTTLAPRPTAPASPSAPASAPAVAAASSSGSQFSANATSNSATSSTPPRRYHMPPPHRRSQVCLDSKQSRVQHESFEFLEKSAGMNFGSVADNADSDLGSPTSLNLSGGGTTPLIFNPR